MKIVAPEPSNPAASVKSCPAQPTSWDALEVSEETLNDWPKPRSRPRTKRYRKVASVGSEGEQKGVGKADGWGVGPGMGARLGAGLGGVLGKFVGRGVGT